MRLALPLSLLVWLVGIAPLCGQEKAKAALLKALDRPKVPADVREDAKPVENGKRVPPIAAGTPRALFIANGDENPNCPVDGARIAMAAEAAYKAAGASDRLAVRVNAGVGHKVTDEDHKAAVEFAVKWLK